MRAASFTALGLAAYSVFLIATIPAAYVGAQVQAAFPGKIEITDARRTLWSGEANFQGAPSRNRVAVHADWRFRPLRLFAGEIAFDIHAAMHELKAGASVARGFNGWRITQIGIDGDAAGVANAVPIFGAWRPSGPIVIEAPEILIRGREVTGSAVVHWREAVTGLSEVRPLGTYKATWTGEASGSRFEVATVKGPLRVAGHGTTTPSLRMTFSGDARAEGDAATALEPLLDLMGPRRPDGARALELRLD
jgi:general secretion pathway protein N